MLFRSRLWCSFGRSEAGFHKFRNDDQPADAGSHPEPSGTSWRRRQTRKMARAAYTNGYGRRLRESLGGQSAWRNSDSSELCSSCTALPPEVTHHESWVSETWTVPDRKGSPNSLKAGAGRNRTDTTFPRHPICGSKSEFISFGNHCRSAGSIWLRRSRRKIGRAHV